MNINDFTQYFDNPAVSVFNRSCSKSFPMRIGPMYPTKWDLLSFGNSGKGNSAHKLRFAPMLVPSYSNISFEEHTAIIPLRTIISNYEQTFNFATNKEGATLPSLSLRQYLNVLQNMLVSGVPVIGSLFDFMGFPVFGDLYKSVDFSLGKIISSSNSTAGYSIFDSQPYSFFINYNIDGDLSTQLSFYYRNASYFVDGFVPFVVFLALKTNLPNVSPIEYSDFLGLQNNRVYQNAMRSFYSSIPGATNEDGSISTTFRPSNDDLIAVSVFETMKSAVEAYQLYVFSYVLKTYIAEINLSDADDLDNFFTTLPLRAYWRFHYDWNTNGNFINRDVELEDYVFNFETTLINYALAASTGDHDDIQKLRDLTQPVNRLWNDDYFTSLLPTSAVDNAVEIPANSTVLNLASLTAWQKFVMKLSYSSRYRDVVWNIFKIKPSDARLQQSYPIFRKSHTVGVGETLQTSVSSPSGVLGDFAGRAYSAGRTKGYHIFCEEPCVLLDFCSLRPQAVYADSLHPLIHVDNILDFPIPDMDVLGNQPITSDYVSGNPLDRTTVLGYGRQYSEWLGNIHTVHGEFKTTLDYWVLTRRFYDLPVINDDFLRIHDADDLDKIFSVPETPHAFVDVFYNAHVTRHVHRNVRIKI